jgi:hypothetical protein
VSIDKTVKAKAEVPFGRLGLPGIHHIMVAAGFNINDKSDDPKTKALDKTPRSFNCTATLSQP